MALTITNINSLSLLNILNRTSTAQSASLTRLSTGQKINRGADDPAGLIALKSFERELTGVNAAINNNQRTDAMLNVADSSLTEVSNLLNEIQGLAAASSNSAGLTASELAANQSQIDNAIASIDRIIRTTEFNGKKLLDGSQAIDATGVDSTKVTDLHIYNRDPNASSNTVTVRVDSAAELADTSAGAGLAANSADVATTISIQGALGTQIIEIAADENLSSITQKIQDAAGVTGVTASQTGATAAIHLKSTGYGSDEFVKVTVLDGGTRGGSSVVNTVNETGVDAVVSVNGQSASTDGKEVYYSSGGTNLSFTLTDSFNIATGAAATESFTVSNTGGATFQLGTDNTTRATIGIDGLYSQQLGSSAAGGYLSTLKSGGSNSLTNNPTAAATIAAAAQSQVSTFQGRVGGFQKYQVQTALNSMNSTKESLTAVKSLIGDTDYAVETANLNQQNVLMQSALSLMGMANQQSAQVLSLLM